MGDLIRKRSAHERLIIAKTLLDSVLQELPTAEPRKGKWISSNPTAPMFGFHYCSLCGRTRTSPQDNYCPNCGARMEE